MRKLAEEKPDLQRALPILDLPVSTAFALSILIIPSIYGQAPLLIYATMGAVTLIPTIVILRRLLERNSYPIFNALVIIALVPLALKGVRYRPDGAAAVLARNLWIYGVGGIIVPFIGIKIIDLILVLLRLT